MVTNENLLSMLEKEIETRILPNKNYPYVPAAAIRTRLNEVFGCMWNTHVISYEVINDDTVLVLLELVGHIENTSIIKEAFGSAPIHKYSSGVNKGKPVNLGDAYGNAVMDSIKSAAKQMGIGNKELDVKKDPKTGKYVRVDGGADTVVEEKPVSSDNLTNIKKRLEANKNKEAVDKKPIEPVKEKVEVKPAEEPVKTVAEEPVVDKTDTDKKTKMKELKEKLAAMKNGNKTKKKAVKVKEETKEEIKEETKEEAPTETKTTEPEETKNEVVEKPTQGFDYSEIENKTNSPKNTQKLVIVNLAKMQKMGIDDYIEKILGKTKSIDDLTADEAGLIVRSGLSSTFE